jgi:8-oxo-dGTP pyrophosphatase MutT (NUDIX family)
MMTQPGSVSDAAALRASITANLAAFDRRLTPDPELKAASVALCIVLAAGGPSLLVTRRSSTLRAHAGQWALPGGRQDAGESIDEAALRELHEETGLRCANHDLLGGLDDFVTRSGYVMTPVVVWGGERTGQFAGAESEVARVHVVPLADLDVEPRFISIPESSAPVIQLPFLGGLMHAPTAAIIYQFCQVALHGRATRVAHFEQPVFAWK